MHELGLYGMLGCEILLLKMVDTNCLLCRRLWSEQAECSVHLVCVNTLRHVEGFMVCIFGKMVHDVEMMLVFIPI